MNLWRVGPLLLLLLLVGCSPSSEEPVADAAITDAGKTEAAIKQPERDAVILTQPSLVPAHFPVPTLVQGEGFKVVPLGPDLVEIDFNAYMSSIEHLQQTFTRSTNWPRADISTADAMLDMETEQSRFQNRTSFAYAVLTPDGTSERGSVYVRPSTKPGYDAEVQLWVTKVEFDAGFDAQLYEWVKGWISEEWPFKQVAYPGRAIEWSHWDKLPNTISPASAQAKDPLLTQNLQTAENLIDAFYSFDPTQLRSFLDHAQKSAPSILYYQGWAEGGNYKVVNREACTAESAELIRCAITVEDDPVLALKTGFNVTDTFAIRFEESHIASIDTSSNDQPIYYEAREWVIKTMPEVMTGPCLGYFDGGATPGDCARAMTEGYRRFYAATAASTYSTPQG